MQVPILNGIYTDSAAPDFRTSYPRNLMPVPKGQGISAGYLKPASGIVQNGSGPASGRGGINWNGVLYRVMGSQLCRVSESGVATMLGDVGDDGQIVSMAYSFDRLAIASNRNLFYWDGTTLKQVTDPDLGVVLDVTWLAGYFITTDGTSLVQTELTDPFSINPLKYGSSEVDPDPIIGVGNLRNELYAFNRYTIETFQNVGGDNFAFQRVDGAMVPRGIIGTQAVTAFLSTFAFVGSGRNEQGPEPPAVYLMAPGDSVAISTREIDLILQDYTEDQLSTCVMESRVDSGHQLLMIHLPDQCLVYDAAASQIVGEPVWVILTTSVVGLGQYQARNLVWCYNRWNVENPTTVGLGILDESISSHYDKINGWDFGTAVLYNEGSGAIVNDMELVCLTGRTPNTIVNRDSGEDPVIWTSYSVDGVTWSQEKSTRCGKRGDRDIRVAWRRQGRLKNWRIQRFRGTSDANVALVRLEMKLEPLYV